MTFANMLRPLMAGILHSFEPDHITAVSVLASENAIKNEKTSFKTVLQASQWAFGHSATLLIFGGLALIFRSTMVDFVENISFVAEVLVGPIMFWLGLTAIKRNYEINEMLQDHKAIEAHEHAASNPIHIHGKSGEEISMNPIKRSFWIGMLHGLAGTGGALTAALVISASTTAEAILVLVIESIGIIVAMGIYSYTLIVTMSRFLDRNVLIFKWMNGLAGLASVLIGIYWTYNSIFGA